METSSIFVTQRGSLSVSKLRSAAQIHAQKCTTKPIAFKPVIDLSSSNTAAGEAVLHSWCFAAKRENLRTHP